MTTENSGLHYEENPFLFVNSGVDFFVPNGRNARIKYRTEQATAYNTLVTKESAHFGVLNFRRSRARNKKGVKARHKSQVQGWRIDNTQCLTSQRMLTPPHASLREDGPDVAADPAKVLAVATFHIRRIAAIALWRNPDRLAEVLRCRQWSSLSITSERVGRCPCLGNALASVASKLLQITGVRSSAYFALSRYNYALQSLQIALSEQRLHDIGDLQATTQLLAVFEMLDSIDNTAWQRHITGAEILSLSKDAQHADSAGSGCSAGTALPMIADAMLNGNGGFFEIFDWRTPFCFLINESQDREDLACCLSDVPELLIEAKSNAEFASLTSVKRYELLDRAHSLKVRLRAELLKADLYERFACGEETSLDELGLYLAGLVCLDRLISWLRPVQMRAREMEKDETTELCNQMLRLELRASDAYPSTDLLSAFQLTGD